MSTDFGDWVSVESSLFMVGSGGSLGMVDSGGSVCTEEEQRLRQE